MTKRFLTAGLVAVGLTGFVMASQWGNAAEPPAYPVPATPEMMQLVRDEHDLVADMIKAQLAVERTGTRNNEGQSTPSASTQPPCRAGHLLRAAEAAEEISR